MGIDTFLLLLACFIVEKMLKKMNFGNGRLN